MMHTKRPSKKRISIILVLLLILGTVILPVSAGTKFLSGAPNISVSITGSNEFTPGTSVPLELSIQNSGLNTLKIVQSDIVDREDQPSTAKMISASLQEGNAPVLIKSDEQMIGDITGSESKKVVFQIRVKDDAPAGKYMLPLHLSYTYLAEAEQQGTDSISYRYNKKDLTVNIPFEVKSAINLAVIKVTPDTISAGGSGYINVSLKNTGRDTGQEAIALINRSGDSPIIPIDSTVYIGTFSPGSVADVKFKISVSRDAGVQEYPLEIRVNYKNSDGDNLETEGKRIGVPIGEKTGFSITSPVPVIGPGSTKTIDIHYRNTGATSLYSAEVRLSAVDPFTSNDDRAYLGDLHPGDVGHARFEITSSDNAVEKKYALDSEIRYRDALNKTHISDTIKVPITVAQTDIFAVLASNAYILSLIVVGILGCGYFLFFRKVLGNRS
ncbi:COG1361 S-layer family protein [Methanospirillum lacunae]|uniref:S-layer protein n=1 Tax=Methanospirillum lacunae TaxID=668570 RepID=A0A2V2NBA3_9EURY|nr:S-layer protein [Methanospirillum lacunae]PWR72573.1 S-layer protein [Methanospirillum lacunae]